MTKSELIKKISEEANVSQAKAERMVDVFLREIKMDLKRGKAVKVGGFGTFTVKEGKARTGINPSTSERIRVKSQKTVTFTPGDKLNKSL